VAQDDRRRRRLPPWAIPPVSLAILRNAFVDFSG